MRPETYGYHAIVEQTSMSSTTEPIQPPVERLTYRLDDLAMALGVSHESWSVNVPPDVS